MHDEIVIITLNYILSLEIVTRLSIPALLMITSVHNGKLMHK